MHGYAPWHSAILFLNHNREESIASNPQQAHDLAKLKKPAESRKHLPLAALVAATVALVGCGLVPENISLSDPKVQPLLKAMEQIDRATLGFTPVTTNAQIRLEIASGRAYDAMLHIYGATSRTIAFRKTQYGYRWISEQEIYEGPKWYQTVDGTFRESIVIEYQTEGVNGIPTNQLYIRYTGSDTNLTEREFTLAEVRPILEVWRTAPAEPRPPDLPGAGENVGAPWFLPMMFLMLVALLVAVCLALIVILVCLAAGTILLAAGVISASLVVGILRRSVSAGFRALFIQLGAVVGMVGGVITTSTFNWIANANWDSPFRWATGLTIGLLIGILFACLFNKVWTRLAQELTRKLERKGN
jgi:hypothetical protein